MLVQGSSEAEGRRAILRTLNRDPFDVWTREVWPGHRISSGLPPGCSRIW